MYSYKKYGNIPTQPQILTGIAILNSHIRSKIFILDIFCAFTDLWAKKVDFRRKLQIPKEPITFVSSDVVYIEESMESTRE